MIITCNECNTRFNVDESLLKETGLKVRCSKCKNVFLAHPSSLYEEQGKAGEVETESEAAITDEEIELGEQHEVEEADTEYQETDLPDTDLLEIEEDIEVEKEPEESELDLELDLEPEIDETPAETEVEKEPEESELDLELDETPAETEAEIEPEPDDKDSSEISAGEEFESIELSADEASEEDIEVEKEPEESELDLELDLEPKIDETPAETEVEKEPEESELELELDETPAETEAEIEPEPDDKTDSKISVEEEPEGIEIDKEDETKIEESEQEDIDKDVIPEEDVSEKIEDEEAASKAFNMGLPDEQEAEKAIEPVDEAEKGVLTEESEQPKVAAKTRISMPVLLLLLAALLISGAYGTCVLLNSVGINIPLVSNLLRPEVQDVGNLKIYASDINNKFVENSNVGQLLVITGKAKNGYSDARSYISITCKLYLKGKILSKTKTVYCGTVLSEPDLINMDFDAINNRLSNRFGDNKSNVKVKEGSIIPFMIVFADLPENLDEVTIEVAGSFPS